MKNIYTLLKSDKSREFSAEESFMGFAQKEVGIFLFEVGDFSSIQKSADIVKENGHELMNSLKFNEVDWTIVVKRKAD